MLLHTCKLKTKKILILKWSKNSLRIAKITFEILLSCLKNNFINNLFLRNT